MHNKLMIVDGKPYRYYGDERDVLLNHLEGTYEDYWLEPRAEFRNLTQRDLENLQQAYEDGDMPPRMRQALVSYLYHNEPANA